MQECLLTNSQTNNSRALGKCHITLQTTSYDISHSQATIRANLPCVTGNTLTMYIMMQQNQTTLPTNQLQQLLCIISCSNDRYKQLHAAAACVTGQSASHGCIKAAHNSRSKDVERVLSPPPPQWDHQHRQHQQLHQAYHRAYRQACRLHHPHTSSG